MTIWLVFIYICIGRSTNVSNTTWRYNISVYISESVYQQMSLTLHDDIISVYICIVCQQMSLILHDDIISVYICIVCQQMYLTLHDDILSVYICIGISTNDPNTTWRYN
jgi:hypothetical protein